MAVRQTKPILVDAEGEEIAVAATPPTNPNKAKDGGPGSKAAVESSLVRLLPTSIRPAKSNGVGQPSGMHDSPTTKAAGSEPYWQTGTKILLQMFERTSHSSIAT